MKKKKLEILLENIDKFRSPKANLEQYITPPNIASQILFFAYSLGDIDGKIIGDFGAGTGIFSIGAELMGAKKIYAVEIDEDAIRDMKNNLRKFECEKIEIIVGDISNVNLEVDTVIQNPPFGSQRKHADLPFLLKAIESGKIIYTMHNFSTADFVRKKIISLGGEITHEIPYRFQIPHIFSFHTHERVYRDVILFRVEKW